MAARRRAARQDAGSAPAEVVVETRHARAPAAARVLRAAAGAFLRELELDGELSITLTSDRRIRVLNREWRAKDKPTDVLSFPQDGAVIGDVVISLDTALRQARDGGWSLPVELRRLLAHGLLHCLGHDHETPREAAKMAAAEEALLGKHGMVGLAYPQLLAGSRKPVARSPSKNFLPRRPRTK